MDKKNIDTNALGLLRTFSSDMLVEWNRLAGKIPSDAIRLAEQLADERDTPGVATDKECPFQTKLIHVHLLQRALSVGLVVTNNDVVLVPEHSGFEVSEDELQFVEYVK